MPKRLKLHFTLDAAEAELLHAMMAYDGWHRSAASAYVKLRMLEYLGQEVADLGRPDVGHVKVSERAMQRAEECQETRWP